MSIHTLQQFLLWCTILNAGLLTLSFILIVTLRGWIYKMHGRFFGLAKEEVARSLYSLLGTYKILIIVFNLVPWLAACLVD